MSAAAALDDIKQRMDEQKNDVQTGNMPEKRTRKESVRGDKNYEYSATARGEPDREH
jgi:hypothetical protein